MNLLYCSDLHGDHALYERLDRAVADVRPRIIVLGGDMLPDDSAMAPEKMGHTQPAYVREVLRPALKRFLKVAGGVRTLFIFGNHDWSSSATAMKELSAEGLVTVLDLQNPVEIDGVHFVGYACCPPTPWYVKDFERLDEPGDRPPLLGGARWDDRFSRPGTHPAAVLFGKAPTMTEELAELKTPPAPWVFVAHAPPYGSDLDQSFSGQSFGSRAVRGVIEQRRPMLSLHGHIHESPRISGKHQQRIGDTVSVNVGQESAALNYAVIDLDAASSAVRTVDHRRLS